MGDDGIKIFSNGDVYIHKEASTSCGRFFRKFWNNHKKIMKIIMLGGICFLGGAVSTWGFLSAQKTSRKSIINDSNAENSNVAKKLTEEFSADNFIDLTKYSISNSGKIHNRACTYFTNKRPPNCGTCGGFDVKF